MSELSKLKEQNPELEITPELADAAEAYDTVKDLKVLYGTPGGKLLVKTLVSDAVSRLHTIRGNCGTMTHQELLKNLMQIDVYLDTAKSLMDAEEAMKLLDAEIEEALRQ